MKDVEEQKKYKLNEQQAKMFKVEVKKLRKKKSKRKKYLII